MNKENYSSITQISLIIIAVIHIVGYIDLKAWLIFSGIGDAIAPTEAQYGYFGLVLLNASAIVLFFAIALIYRYSSRGKLFNLAATGIAVVFFLRGIIGIIMVAIGITGSASAIWELVFSVFSLVVGITAWLGLEVRE